MKKTFYGFIIFIGLGSIIIIYILSEFASGFGAGTHGSIKSYDFKVSKFELEKAIDKIYQTDSLITRDTSTTDYYNKDGYEEMTIRKNNKVIKYNFRYYGDSTIWNTTPYNSEIFICYLYDSKGKVISEGNDKIKSNTNLVNEQLTIFEEEFIRRINQELNK